MFSFLRAIAIFGVVAEEPDEGDGLPEPETGRAVHLTELEG